MALEELEGKAYGPFAFRFCSEKVSEFVLATSDDPDRWRRSAPPAMAAAALFVVAPHLLAEAGEGFVIHGDQSFEWARPMRVESDVEVAGRVTRVRKRSGVGFIGFEMQVRSGEEDVVSGRSTFLVSAAAGESGEAVEEAEPPPEDEMPNPPPEPAELPPPGHQVPPLQRVVSRSGLVRYAAATRDWNPIHWDHQAGVDAGLPGVVVHGLLQSAWLLQSAARFGPGDAPLHWARFRYRAPLRPSTPVAVEGVVTTESALELALIGGETSFVSATIELAR